MILVSNNVEAKLLDSMKALKDDIGDHYALHFHISLLGENYRSDFQLRIAINILNDLFRKERGNIFISKNGDMFVIYKGKSRALLEKAIFQLRYLFVDDPLANHKDGSENEDFCTMYDLTFQWKQFFKICSDLMGIAAKYEVEERKREKQKQKGLFTPAMLVDVEAELNSIELAFAVRMQPICAIKKTNEVNPVFNEIYLNMQHFRRLISVDCDVKSDLWLFKKLTESFDEHVMDIIADRPKAYLKTPISMNINARTILSPEFEKFSEMVKKNTNSSIILEIGVEDVFADVRLFLGAKDVAKSYGFRICIDGLNTETFVQVDRERLGFDLAKMRWNADMAGDLISEKNKQLARAIRQCGPNRMILCRCDSEHAIEYGHALGISLFQGRYPDKVLDPDTMIIN